MSRLTDFFQQLSKRRVIRAGVLYAAGLWLILQVADLLAQAGMVSDDFVRWMILLGLIFFPVTLALTWFFEHPWHERPWLAMAGDIAMLLIISLAAGLLAHEQWTKSFTLPVVAVLNLEPTDAQPGTGNLAGPMPAGRWVKMILFVTFIPLKRTHAARDSCVVCWRGILTGWKKPITKTPANCSGRFAIR